MDTTFRREDIAPENNPLQLNLANRVSDKLKKAGTWHNVNVEWSHHLRTNIVTAFQVVLDSEAYLKLATFIPLSQLDRIQPSFFHSLEQDSKATGQSHSGPKLNHQYVLAVMGYDDELILQSISFGLKRIH